jgi:fluoride ion exporter CrcB/FEX
MLPLFPPPAVLLDACAIGVGAVAGALSRYQVGKVAGERIATMQDPVKRSGYEKWHTAGINIVGSFILGGVAAAPTYTSSQSSSAVTEPPSASSSPSQSPPKSMPMSAGQATASSSTSTAHPHAAVTSKPPKLQVPFPSSPSPLTSRIITMTPRQKLLLGIGFCGSFTTFSTYSVDVVTMLQNGQSLKALQYVGVNNIGGISAAAVGMMLMRHVRKFFDVK